MKKILSIIALAITAIMLSSCVVHVNAETVEPPTYRIYFYNDTAKQFIFDWYVEDEDGGNYELSDEYREIECGEYDYIDGLEKDYYRVVFCISSDYSEDWYVRSNLVFVNSDTTFRLSDKHYYDGKPRSALSSETSSEETDLVLIDSNGNEYPITRN